MKNKKLLKKMKDYNEKLYINDLKKNGLKTTWRNIINYLLLYEENKNFLNINNLSEIYEFGLAYIDKNHKKNNGKYYTPSDVSNVMSKWLADAKGNNVCDVGCGTGNLILNYLEIIGFKKARKLILNNRLFLYDIDPIAIEICKISIMKKYGLDLESHININLCDFLDKKITLPKNSKVISNPPYARIENIKNSWKKSIIILDSKEYYSAFMEKIIEQSDSSVIITPYSFVSGTKFYSLRKKMCEIGNGSILSFDNVPGNMFRGKKYGIFNTNNTNSVRASITIFNKSDSKYGFKVSPFIRFKNSERNELIQNSTLEKFLKTKRQVVSKKHPSFIKCDKDLIDIYNKWINKSNNKTLLDLIDRNGKFILWVPKSPRYYVTASNFELNRKNQYMLKFSNYNHYIYVYCMINSSFAYWFWRMFDGGITFSQTLLYKLPIFFESIVKKDFNELENIAKEMFKISKKYITIKNNIGKHENIKFPKEMRDYLNKKILTILGMPNENKKFDKIHSNMALKINL